ncbi:uncharacterized protein LAJ45_10050 [Morchella importuna]|uniref:uncharacterized protein n=1 Tax=Morchella importuna TaxID=1174673 RepID=UPI001E8D0415|nr:uncharacterized protein LAJ45_10050 [Morchella importuna]KAH8145908.1 hypothetical protein LAJ45_10050 [Morchella importuna]
MTQGPANETGMLRETLVSFLALGSDVEGVDKIFFFACIRGRQISRIATINYMLNSGAVVDRGPFCPIPLELLPTVLCRR